MPQNMLKLGAEVPPKKSFFSVNGDFVAKWRRLKEVDCMGIFVRQAPLSMSAIKE